MGRSFSIAIDSGYGTGKTIFLEKLKDRIENKQREDGVTNGVVIYNAWQADFAQNPLLALMSALLEEDCFVFVSDKEKAKKFGSDLKEKVVDILKALSDLHPAVATMAALCDKKEHADSFLKYQGTIKKFQEQIKSTLYQANIKKLVIVIDELDRCRPTFAIETLEVVKHIMDIENVIFIYALDMPQLEATVRQIYGDAIDANGYLCKMFHYITRMPRPEIRAYIEQTIKRELVEKRPDFIEWFQQVALQEALSLRDINAILKNYSIIYSLWLKDYGSILAQKMYLALLVLKYKKPETYKKLFLGQNVSLNEGVSDAIEKLASKASTPIWDYYENNLLSDPMGICFMKDSEDKRECSGRKRLSEQPNATYDGILFECDLKNYKNICKMTYGEYVRKKLEMLFYHESSADLTEK